MQTYVVIVIIQIYKPRWLNEFHYCLQESLPPAIVQRSLKYWQEEAIKDLTNIAPFEPCSTDGYNDINNGSQGKYKYFDFVVFRLKKC